MHLPANRLAEGRADELDAAAGDRAAPLARLARAARLMLRTCVMLRLPVREQFLMKLMLRRADAAVMS